MNKCQLESSCLFSYCSCNSIGWPFLSCILFSECLKICFKKLWKLKPYKQCQIKWMLKLKLLHSEFFLYPGHPNLEVLNVLSPSHFEIKSCTIIMKIFLVIWLVLIRITGNLSFSLRNVAIFLFNFYQD